MILIIFSFMAGVIMAAVICKWHKENNKQQVLQEVDQYFKFFAKGNITAYQMKRLTETQIKFCT